MSIGIAVAVGCFNTAGPNAGHSGHNYSDCNLADGRRRLLCNFAWRLDSSRYVCLDERLNIGLDVSASLRLQAQKAS